MENVIKTDTMKTSILDIVTLSYPNFFIQKFPNSLGLGQLIFNFHLKTSAGFFFFLSIEYTFPPFSSHCPIADLFQELSFLLNICLILSLAVGNSS